MKLFSWRLFSCARPIAVSATAAAFLWACPVGVLAGDYDLRPKFKPGPELYYKQTTIMRERRQISVREGPDHTQVQTMTTEVGYRFRTIEVKPDKSAVVEWTLAYFALDSDSPKMPKYDSRSEEFKNHMLAGVFGPRIDKPATLTIAPDGKVIDVKGFEAPASADPRQSVADNVFSEQHLKQLPILRTAGVVHPTPLGSIWTEHNEYEMARAMGTMLVDSEYKLDKVNDGKKLAEIECRGTMKLKEVPAGEGAEQTPPLMKINKGELTARLFWDLAKGELARAETTTEMVMERQTPMGGVTISQAATQQIVRTIRAEFGLKASKPKDTPPQKAADDSSIR